MNTFIYKFILFFVVTALTSCKLKISEDNDYFIPAYRTKQIDSVTVEISLHKRYFVQNYRHNKEQFDSTALNIICQAINDSIPITDLDFTFIDGPGELLYEEIAEYLWNVDTPNKITIIWRDSQNYRDEIIPFNCKLNKNYRKRDSTIIK